MNETTFENEVLNAEPTPVNPAELPQNAPTQPLKNNPLFKKKFCFASITYLLQTGIVFVFIALNFIGFMQSFPFAEQAFQVLEHVFSGELLPNDDYLLSFGVPAAFPFMSSTISLVACLIMIISLVVMAIMLFAKCHKPIIILPFFGFMLSNLMFIIKGFIYSETTQYFMQNYDTDLDHYRMRYRGIFSMAYAPTLSHIFVLLSALLPLIFVIILSIKVKEEVKEKSIIQKIWFIPGIIRVLMLAAFPAEYIMEHWDAFMGVGTESTAINAIIFSIEPVLMYLPLIVSEFLLCMWLASPYKKIVPKKKPQPVQPVQPVVQYVPVMQPAAEPNAAQQLMEYKNLLDMGAITQEEFEAKKKQILGL